jgi:hypothetical protein
VCRPRTTLCEKPKTDQKLRGKTIDNDSRSSFSPRGRRTLDPRGEFPLKSRPEWVQIGFQICFSID